MWVFFPLTKLSFETCELILMKYQLWNLKTLWFILHIALSLIILAEAASYGILSWLCISTSNIWNSNVHKMLNKITNKFLGSCSLTQFLSRLYGCICYWTTGTITFLNAHIWWNGYWYWSMLSSSLSIYFVQRLILSR